LTAGIEDDLRCQILDAKSRVKLALVAKAIIENRSCPVSTAAKATLAILFTHGPEAAEVFAADLARHEG
jgi:hypothetical protein